MCFIRGRQNMGYIAYTCIVGAIWMLIPSSRAAVCPVYDIPVMKPCVDGSVSGTRILFDTSEMPTFEFSCNCYLTTNEDKIDISMLKAPGYQNCGSQIQFSSASLTTFRCTVAGTSLDTSRIKSVGVIVQKEIGFSDVRYCGFIQVSVGGNVSLTCSSNVVTTSAALATPTTSLFEITMATTLASPTTQQVTAVESTSLPPSTTLASISLSQTTILESTSLSQTIPLERTSLPQTTTLESTYLPQTTTLESTYLPQTTTLESISSTMESSSTAMESISTDLPQSTSVGSTTSSQNTQHATTALIPEVDSETPQPISTEATQSTSGNSTEGLTTVSPTVVTTSPTINEQTKSSGKMQSSIPYSTTHTVTKTDHQDSTTQQSMPSAQSTLVDDEDSTHQELVTNTINSLIIPTTSATSNVTKAANTTSDRMISVIVISSLIGVFLIVILIGAICYQKRKQRQREYKRAHSTYANMALKLDEEKGREVSENKQNNCTDESPNLIPYDNAGKT